MIGSVESARQAVLRRCRWRVVAIALLGMAVGCGTSYKPADLGGLYTQAAQYESIGRRPIIVIPGILGSELVDRESERTVWGAFAGGYARPDRADGARAVALPLVPGVGDRVEATAVLERLKIRILGLPLALKAYLNIIQVLGAGGYADESFAKVGIDYGESHYTCFQFAYDFRLDNSENARRLHEFILEKRRFVQGQIAERFGVVDAEVKFDIVAHSMGSLLTRYFLRYGEQALGDDGPLPELNWAGAEYVERAILVGPPNGGTIEALLNLVEGEKFGPIVPRYPPAVLGTFPSVYQLMPRSRHAPLVWGDGGEPIGELTDPALWKDLGWGLASSQQAEVLAWLLPEVDDADERQRIAQNYLAWALRRAERFTAALDRPAPPPAGLELFLVTGDSVPTARRAVVDRDTGAVRVTERAAGDGRVLRSSALMDEREAYERASDAWEPIIDSPIDWTATLFLPDNHLGLTSNPVFSDNMLYWLLEAPRRAGPAPEERSD